jgi:hypothetical protein
LNRFLLWNVGDNGLLGKPSPVQFCLFVGVILPIRLHGRFYLRVVKRADFFSSCCGQAQFRRGVSSMSFIGDWLGGWSRISIFLELVKQCEDATLGINSEKYEPHHHSTKGKQC